jgi:hypothetical protein
MMLGSDRVQSLVMKMKKWKTKVLGYCIPVHMDTISVKVEAKQMPMHRLAPLSRVAFSGFPKYTTYRYSTY